MCPYRQKDSANWWISYTDAAGKRVRRSAGTEVYADAKAEEQRLRAAHHVTRKKSGGVGVDTVLLEYLQRDNRSNDRNKSKARAIIGAFAGRQVAELDRAAIHAYADRRRESVGESTIKRELTLLGAAISEYNRRHGTELPNHARSLPLREPEGRVRWITREEANRLIAAASPAVADYITLSLYTGMRRGEVLGLEWSRVDLARRTVRLESQHTKSRRGRTIPLHDRAVAALASCRARHPDHALVFGGVQDFKKGFAGACRRAGIHDFRPHDLRHTCASWLVMAGTPLYEVRDILGHASITQTERYSHLAQENLAVAIGRL